MLFPAATGFGAPLFVTVRSHATLTLVTTVVLLFDNAGSLVEAVTEEFAVIDATATAGPTFTTTMMSAVELAFMLGLVQVTEAVTVQDQPAGAPTETNVVLAGITSVKLTFEAAAGPLFVTVCVYVMLLPANTALGVATVLSARSACMAVATTSVAVAVLSPAKESLVALTVTVSIITVPLAVPAFTL